MTLVALTHRIHATATDRQSKVCRRLPAGHRRDFLAHAHTRSSSTLTHALTCLGQSRCRALANSAATAASDTGCPHRRARPLPVDRALPSSLPSFASTPSFSPISPRASPLFLLTKTIAKLHKLPPPCHLTVAGLLRPPTGETLSTRALTSTHWCSPTLSPALSATTDADRARRSSCQRRRASLARGQAGLAILRLNRRLQDVPRLLLVLSRLFSELFRLHRRPTPLAGVPRPPSTPPPPFPTFPVNEV